MLQDIAKSPRKMIGFYFPIHEQFITKIKAVAYTKKPSKALTIRVLACGFEWYATCATSMFGSLQAFYSPTHPIPAQQATTLRN